MDINDVKNMLDELSNEYTQAELAELLKIPQGTISKIRNGVQKDIRLSGATRIKSKFYEYQKNKT